MLITEINTFKDPLIDRFIMGQEPLANFDNFVAGIRRAGLDELLTMLMPPTMFTRQICSFFSPRSRGEKN